MLRRSSTSTTLELDASETRELLDRLQTRIKEMGEEHYQILQDIHRMTDGALTQAQSELEDNSIAQNYGVLVQMFIPLMTCILRQTLGYVENNLALSSQNLQPRTSLLQIGSRKTKNKSSIYKELLMFRNNLEGIYLIAMPPGTPSATSSDRTDDVLDIASRIGSTLSVLSDSIPALGPLRLVGAALSEVCSAVQTLRSNHKLATEIMYGTQEYFRMVVRKIQTYPAAQVDEELRRDVDELLNILLCVQKTLLEMKRKKRHVGSSVLFSRKDQDSLNALMKQVRESRSMFEGKPPLNNQPHSQL